eukprot:6100192-Prymnesium_polylepis.1
MGSWLRRVNAPSATACGCEEFTIHQGCAIGPTGGVEERHLISLPAVAAVRFFFLDQAVLREACEHLVPRQARACGRRVEAVFAEDILRAVVSILESGKVDQLHAFADERRSGATHGARCQGREILRQAPARGMEGGGQQQLVGRSVGIVRSRAHLGEQQPSELARIRR